MSIVIPGLTSGVLDRRRAFVPVFQQVRRSAARSKRTALFDGRNWRRYSLGVVPVNFRNTLQK